MVFPYALKKLVHFSRKRKKETLSSEVEDLDRRLQRKAEASTTTKKDSSIDDSKPLVKCNIHGLTFNALLDACSSGLQGYIVNCIHPDVVNKITDHEKSTKKQILKRCSCLSLIKRVFQNMVHIKS